MKGILYMAMLAAALPSIITAHQAPSKAAAASVMVAL